MNKITFQKATTAHKEIIFSWLAEPHMIEFWDNSQEHRDDVLNFIHGRKQQYFAGTTKYFIALADNVPFAFILGDVMKADENLSSLQKEAMSKFGNTIAVDFGIGNSDYIGKGIASQTLEKFILYYQEDIDPKADTFFIDPDENNQKAKHVYEKAGFKHIGEYKPTEGAFVGHTNLSLVKRISLGNYLDKELAKKLISTQFAEYADLTVTEVEQQGHDNRTYRIGDDMLIRMPTAESYALKVPMEQELLPKLAKHLSIAIPAPIKMGYLFYSKETLAVARKMSKELAQPILIGEHKRIPKFDKANVKVSKVYYPYPFSIYKWLDGRSANHVTLDEQSLENLAFDLATFLKELQAITDVEGPSPGQQNWYRGDHVSVYDSGAREQIAKLADIIDSNSAIDLWRRACATKWNKTPIWIHGDFAVRNILIKDNKLKAIIDFGGTAMGDPACDLVIAWTYLSGKARDIFVSEMGLDEDTWLRARAWVLWKATFELCNIADKNSPEALAQKKIIDEVINE